MQRDEFLRESLHQRSVGRRPARVDPDVAILRPPELLEPLAERPDAGLCFRVALGIGGQYADPSHPAGLLRARGERPRRAPCYQRYELAPLHARLRLRKSIVATQIGILEVLSDVRFGSQADICNAQTHVRFTPNSAREIGLPQTVMSALPSRADMRSAKPNVC